MDYITKRLTAGEYTVSKMVAAETAKIVKESGSWVAYVPGMPAARFAQKREALEAVHEHFETQGNRATTAEEDAPSASRAAQRRNQREGGALARAAA